MRDPGSHTDIGRGLTRYPGKMPSAVELDNGVPEAGTELRVDRYGDVGRGVFPGLGTVCVQADGASEVPVEDAPDRMGQEQVNRERAHRFGWGEPLSFARGGLRCAAGAAVVPPADDGCLLLAALPYARLRLDSTTVATDVDALLAWWRTITAPVTGADG